MNANRNRKRIPSDVAETALERWVVRWINRQAANYDDGAAGAIRDAQHGCSSGIVSELIYNRDCAKFARKHLSDILALLDDYADSMGEPLAPNRKQGYELDETWLAWVGFELALDRVASRAGY